MKLKIYVGCSLTHAPESYKKDIEILKDRLRERSDIEVFEFIGLTDGTPVDVYKHDIHTCVAECDLFVAECSYASLGLGWEIGTAVEKLHIPVLAVAHRDKKVSRLALGADCKDNPHYTFAYYKDINELIDLVQQKIDALRSKAI